jgi:protein-tyrosine phosphatase
MKVLMVCLGNICRSPLAEGIMREKIKKAGLDWQVDSAVTRGYMLGCAPHEFSQKVARMNGLDIRNLSCRNFTIDDMDSFDKIYVMDENNYRTVKSISGNKWNKHKVDFLMNEVYPGSNKEVPDPWEGGEEGFHMVYKMIEKACESIIKQAKI